MAKQQHHGIADEATPMHGQVTVTLNNTRLIDATDTSVTLELFGIMQDMPEIGDMYRAIELKLEPIEFYTLEAAVEKALKQIALLRAMR